MPAKKSASKKASASPPKYIDMVVMAIKEARDFTRGASRAKIASWIKSNYPQCDTGAFNTALRNALNKGIEDGVLAQGETSQRFKHVPAALKAAEKTPKKKAAAKKTPAKKTPSKKGKKSSAAKKTPSKKGKGKKAATKKPSAKKTPAKKGKKAKK
ncbi:MAG: hypothetical protein MHM6MM_004996 [Cercozoa sp. M6MM]